MKRLMRDMAARVPELSNVRASRVLVVAGEARGTSRATIRPASIGAARDGDGRRRFVRVRGRRMLYVITLRPLWFVASTPNERIATILHELYHASAQFDGTLHGDRRHRKLPRPSYDRRIRSLLAEYLGSALPDVLAPFASDGIVKVTMWLRVPSSAGQRRSTLDVDEHLMQGFMPLRTHGRRPARGHVASARSTGHDEEEGAW